MSVRRSCAYLLVAASLALAGCPKPADQGSDAGGSSDAGNAEAPVAPSSEVPRGSPSASAEPPKRLPLACPDGMLLVNDAFCVDRWEASLVDKATKTPLSPYYPPSRKLAIQLHDTWERDRATMGDDKARATPLPPLPVWQRAHDAQPMAVSRPGVVPNGYLSGVVAAEACRNAGKRLCQYEEWLTACEGEQKRQFPYGEAYKQGACNIFRSAHPGQVLHDDMTTGHLDPRLDLVRDERGEPLLRRTGETPACKSVWGDDAAMDMNGNLDEWVDDERPRFAGGFFSRSKKDGCKSSVTAHPVTYLDYSTGTRCCWAPPP